MVHPPPPGPIGRQQELDALLAAYEAADHGRPQLVVVSGESGMGKTTLVDALAERLPGALRLRGTCFPYASGDLAYSAFVQAFRRVGRHPAVEALSLSDRSALQPLFPLAVEKSPLDRSRWGSTRFAELTLRLVGDLAAEQVLVLVVEDVHWTDQGSLDLLSFLAVNLTYERVLVVLTVRSDEPDTPLWFRAGLASLRALPSCRSLELGPLAEADALALWRRTVGEDLAPVPAGSTPEREAVARAGGNPFFVTELAGARRSSGPRGPERLAVRLAGLGAPAQQVLRLLALAGLPLPYAALQAATDAAGSPGPGDGGLDAAVRRLRDTHLVVLTGAGELAVRHALVADAVQAELLPSEQAALHRALAEAADRRPESFGRTSEARVVAARQWQLAGEPARALLPLVESGRSAAARHADADAARLFAEALRTFDEVPADQRPTSLSYGDLLTRYARAVRWTDGAAEGARLVSEALARATDLLPAERVALLEQLARLHHELGDDDQALAAATQAVRLAGSASDAVPPFLVARAFATSGAVHLMRGEYALGLAPLEAALERSRVCGAVEETAYALSLAGAAMSNLGRMQEAEAALLESVSLADRLDDPEAQVRSRLNLSYVYENAGDWQRGLDAAETGLQIARSHGLEHTASTWLAGNKAYSLIVLGRWPEADRLLEAYLDRPAPSAARRYLELLRVELDVALGRLDRAAEQLASLEATRSVDAVSEGQLSLDRGLLAAATHNLDGALAAVEDGLVADDGEVEPILGLRLCALGLRMLALRAEQQRIVRDGGADAAEQQAERLLATAETLAGQAHDLRPCQQELRRCRLEHERVRQVGAAEDWEDLAEDCSNQPYAAAYAWSVAAGLRLQEGPAGRPRAASAVRRAAELLTGLGEVPLRRSVVALAASCRVRLEVPARAVRVEPAVSPASRLGLTPREQQVLERVAAGDTNREIGKTLFISERTAGVHVGNLLAKLQVRSRAEATAAAHRLGLVS